MSSKPRRGGWVEFHGRSCFSIQLYHANAFGSRLSKMALLGEVCGIALKKPRPELAVIKPEKLGKSRARMLNPTVVERYMTDLGQKIYELKLNYKPNLIWNCDETGKQFQHNPVEVIAQKGAKNRTNITHGLY